MFNKFDDQIKAKGSRLCVGMDTVLEQAPISDLLKFNKAIVDSTLEHAACFKFQLAFYEQLGMLGMDLLEKTLAYIRLIAPETPIIGDAKRCDVGHSAAAYAQSLYSYWGVDNVTLLPYLGDDAIRPFLKYEEKSAFVVCHTSNPSARYIQQLRVEIDGENPPLKMQLYEYVAQMVATIDPKHQQLGLVVGATYTEQLSKLRERYPSMFFLIPGIGAQGGDLKKTVAGVSGGRFLVNVSRSILYASENPADFHKKAGETARYFKEAINVALENTKNS